LTPKLSNELTMWSEEKERSESTKPSFLLVQKSLDQADLIRF